MATLPLGYSALPFGERFEAAAAFLQTFGYNHTAEQHFNVDKARPLAALLTTARCVIRVGRPIKCVEATFVALLLTQGHAGVDRVPVSFKSVVGGRVYRHLVLLIRAGGRWGALGLSRKAELASQPLVFSTASAVLAQYRDGYAKWGHDLRLIFLGLAVLHDAGAPVPCWRYTCIRAGDGRPWSGAAALMDAHVSRLDELQTRWAATGRTAITGREDAAVRTAAAASTQSGGEIDDDGGEEPGATGGWWGGAVESDAPPDGLVDTAERDSDHRQLTFEIASDDAVGVCVAAAAAACPPFAATVGAPRQPIAADRSLSLGVGLMRIEVTASNDDEL